MSAMPKQKPGKDVFHLCRRRQLERRSFGIHARMPNLWHSWGTMRIKLNLLPGNLAGILRGLAFIGLLAGPVSSLIGKEPSSPVKETARQRPRPIPRIKILVRPKKTFRFPRKNSSPLLQNRKSFWPDTPSKRS